MKVSKELMTVAKIIPKLRLGNKTEKGVVSTGPHIVKVLEDKIIKGKDMKGREIEYVRYTLEEKGEKKIYDTKLKNEQGELSYLVQRFAEIEEGQEARLEMKKRGMKNYISVDPIHNGNEVEIGEDEGEIEEIDTTY